MPSTGSDEALFHRVSTSLAEADIGHEATLVVGFSGGPDSTCLLSILSELCGAGRVVAAYFDHGTRSAEEHAAESRHVRRIADRLGVRLDSGHVEPGRIAEEASRARKSTEAVARAHRYRFFCEALARHNAGVLALGHTADDQTETVLMRLLSGSGLTGLAGMPEHRPLDLSAPHTAPGRRAVLVRPLITSSRAELLSYLERHGLPYVEDRSNRDTQHLRNRVRRELLPQARRLVPDVDERVRSSARKLREIDLYLGREADGMLPLRAEAAGVSVDRTRFFSAPPPLRLYALFSMAEEVLTDASEIPRRFFNPLLGADSGEAHKTLTRGYGLRLRLQGQRLFCEDDVVLSREKGYVLAVPQRREPSRHVMIHVSVTPSLGAERREHTVVLDSRGLHFPLVLRSWRRGDAIILPDGAKDVKTLLSASRVPTAWRGRVPVLEDRQGVVGVFLGLWNQEDILRTGARGEVGGFHWNGAVLAELDLDEV